MCGGEPPCVLPSALVFKSEPRPAELENPRSPEDWRCFSCVFGSRRRCSPALLTVGGGGASQVGMTSVLWLSRRAGAIAALRRV